MQNAEPLAVEHDRAIVAWLWILFSTLFVMVMLGGITRLTGSGLSMVDWRPLMGTLPPLGESQWNEVFDAYKASPQYTQVNEWMQLADFKRIFFWEYTHRLMGRLIGVVAFVPWLYFVARGRLQRWLSFRVVIAIALGGAQGLLGWFMVQSGLVDRPEVSHLRLAAHLLLAFAIAQWILVILLDLRWGRVTSWRSRNSNLMFAFIALLTVQIAYGAFMAGTHAGALFPSFPDMNGGYAPSRFFLGASLYDDLLYSPVAIHYTHRVLGFLMIGSAGWILFAIRGSERAPSWVKAQFGSALVLQFVLGAFTALYQAPISLAIAHQAGAFVLACSATLLAHRTASQFRED